MLSIFTEDLNHLYKEGDNTIIFRDKKFHYMDEEADVKTFNGTEYKVLNFKRDYSWKEKILPRIKFLSLAIVTLGFLFLSPKFRKDFTAAFAKEEKLQLNILSPKIEEQADEVELNNAGAAYYKALVEDQTLTISRLDKHLARLEEKFSAYFDKKKTHAEIQKY